MKQSIIFLTAALLATSYMGSIAVAEDTTNPGDNISIENVHFTTVSEHNNQINPEDRNSSDEVFDQSQPTQSDNGSVDLGPVSIGF